MFLLRSTANGKRTLTYPQQKVEVATYLLASSVAESHESGCALDCLPNLSEGGEPVCHGCPSTRHRPKLPASAPYTEPVHPQSKFGPRPPISVP